MIDVVRSVIFYAVFYFGSIFYVLGSLAMAPVSHRAFNVLVTGWSSYHRACAALLLGIRVRIEGEVPAGGVLVAIRHESFFEAIDLPHAYDLPVVFAKAELLALPLWGKVARLYGMIPVEREQGAKALRAMLKLARERVAEGRVLTIFPEGTRVWHGTRAPLQSGFAGLYKLLGLPVVPVAVDSGRLYHRTWKRAGTITYRYGALIPAGLPRDEIEARVLAAINDLNTGA